MNFLRCLFLLGAMALTGCSLAGQHSPKEQETSRLTQTGKIVHQNRLAQGKSLRVVLFKPGEGVEASEEVEKISLMIVRGLAENIQESKDWTFLTADDPQASDFLVIGHITETRKPGMWKKWTMGPQTPKVAVEGRLVDARTKEIVTIFSIGREAIKKNVDHQQLGLLIGQDIGRYLQSMRLKSEVGNDQSGSQL